MIAELDTKQRFKNAEWEHAQEHSHVHVSRQGWKNLECVGHAIAPEKAPKKKPETGLRATSNAAFVRAFRTALRASILAQEQDRIQVEADFRAYSGIQKVVDATTELFGKNVLVESDCDPEFPDDRYTVFRVEAPVSTAIQLEEEWVRRVNAIVKGADTFRLSIVPKT